MTNIDSISFYLARAIVASAEEQLCLLMDFAFGLIRDTNEVIAVRHWLAADSQARLLLEEIRDDAAADGFETEADPLLPPVEASPLEALVAALAPRLRSLVNVVVGMKNNFLSGQTDGTAWITPAFLSPSLGQASAVPADEVAPESGAAIVGDSLTVTTEGLEVRIRPVGKQYELTARATALGDTSQYARVSTSSATGELDFDIRSVYLGKPFMVDPGVHTVLLDEDTSLTVYLTAPQRNLN